MIYDTAMKVDLDNGLRFIANFRYNTNKEFTKVKDPSKIQIDSIKLFDSDCSKTMVGTVLRTDASKNKGLKNVRVQCFYAIQKENLHIE